MKNLIEKHLQVARAAHMDTLLTAEQSANITAQACCLFGPWLNEHYVLITSKKMDRSAYVNKAHNVLIHGSDMHYTNLIMQHGKSVNELFLIFLKTNPPL